MEVKKVVKNNSFSPMKKSGKTCSSRTVIAVAGFFPKEFKYLLLLENQT